jgi:hypothetical protein
MSATWRIFTMQNDVVLAGVAMPMWQLSESDYRCNKRLGQKYHRGTDLEFGNIQAFKIQN